MLILKKNDWISLWGEEATLRRIPEIYVHILTSRSITPTRHCGLHMETSLQRMHACSVTRSCQTLCNPIDCSPPDSSVHGILQAAMLELVAVSYSRGFSWPRDWTHISCISCIGRQTLYHWASWEALQQGKRKQSNFTVKKCDSHSFRQITKVHLNSGESCWCTYSWYDVMKMALCFCNLPPKKT